MANLTKLVGIEMWWWILCQLNTWERCFVSQWHRWLASQWEPPLWSSGYQSGCTTTKLQTFQHLTMSKCPKEMRKIYVASWILFTLTAEADRVLYQLVMFFFNCLFPLNVQSEIQLLSRVFCYSWLVCLLGFWLRNTLLVKVGNPISDGIVFVFHLR